MNMVKRFVALVVLVGSNLLVAPAAFADEVPNPKPNAPDGVKDMADKIIGLLKWGGLAFAIAGLLIIGIKMMSGRDNGRGGRDGIDALGYWAGGMVLVGGAASIVSFFMA
ncbi:TrbC/VirB2 family protein [Nocardioides sp. Bht2]|uniref:TrbC/VirB2 family protein n=1 Tax=Nocardioides sp. Bht2 TaxID=3392297 RepID=UPI0039B58640